MKIVIRFKPDVDIYAVADYISELPIKSDVVEKTCIHCQREIMTLNKYKFELQNRITVTVLGVSKEQARRELIENLAAYEEDMIRGCTVSDGEEL